MHLALLLWLAFQSLSPEALEHVRAGMQAKEQGHLDVAIAEFQKVTELEPNLAPAFVNLGAAYLDNHDQSAAIPPLRKALELNPDLAGAHQMLGVALLSQGYAAEAVPHLEKARAQDALGIALLETGRFAEAITSLKAALEQRPNDPDLLYYLGRASGLLSKQVFDTLLADHPDSARAHQAIAENYVALRKVPEAEEQFRQAIKLRPDLPGAHLALGRVYALAAQWPKAEEQFLAETKLRPGDAEATYRLGDALLQQGKINESLPALERADQLRPNMPETLYVLGKAASLSGDTKLAEQSWENVIKLEKEGSLAAQAHFGLSALYRKQGNAAAAEREMEEYRKLQKPGASTSVP
jgi:tetratricopeptide (TPR) repeat protein